MVAVGVAARPLPGELVNGDCHVVAEFTGGTVIAAIDGLGHGPEAADAAQAAVKVIVRCAAMPVIEIVQECHRALRRTRGVAMSVASFRDATMSWIAVGNVEAVLVRAGLPPLREHLFLRGGIVGHNLPSPRDAVLELAEGDTVILATDGIRPGFATGLELHAGPAALAQAILSTYSRSEDDALVLVARYARAA